MNDQLIAYIRTFTPIVVGFVLTWLAETLGIVIDAESSSELVATVQAALTAGYYALVSAFARKFVWLGWLLGYPTKPTYQ